MSSLLLFLSLCPLRVLTAETITHHLSTDSDAQEDPLAAVPAARWYPGVARGHLDAQGLPRTVAPITSAALPASGGDAAVPVSRKPPNTTGRQLLQDGNRRLGCRTR